MQLPQHCTCKIKHHFQYVNDMATSHERIQFHEGEYNLHESEMVPTKNSILTQRHVDC